MPVEIRLFGAPQILVDGARLSLKRTRGLALLAYLAAGEAPVTRDALLGLLWPDFTAADARNGLRRELSLLRKHLGDDVLQADRQQVAVSTDPGLVQVDVREFKRIVGGTGNVAGAADQISDQCAADLKTASDLYSDDFLAGFSLPDSPAFDEWQFYLTDQLRQSLALALDQLADHHAERGEHEAALGYARRRLALNPTDEAAARNLMRLLGWSGQLSAALRTYEDVRKLLQSEFDLEPDEETTSLYERIRTRRLPPPQLQAMPVGERTSAAGDDRLAATPRHNLPADITPFVGRETELARLDDLLADPAVRLVTILAPGGMGKTRLATAAAGRQLNGRDQQTVFRDGIFFVSLAPLRSSEDIVPAIARAMGFSFEGQTDPAEQLIRYLRPRRTLLVLDNFEHLIDEASAALPGRILEGAPDVSILVTSRARLNARSEHVFGLGGLEDLEAPAFVQAASGRLNTEAELQTLRGQSTIRLFEISAQRVLPAFAITQDNAPFVARIAQLVGGMPLGIELAAGWVEMFAPVEIAAEIEESLDFLESTWQDAPERQTSLRAVFDTSWRLLTEHEQQVLAQLSLFRGGFERRSAEAVTGASIRTLHALVSKSWLQRGDGQRFQFHELLRQYAEEQLQSDSGGYVAARERYARHYADYVTELDREFRGAKPGPALAAFERDLENIRAAWFWLIEHNRLADAVALMLPGIFLYAETRVHFEFLKGLVDAAIAALPADAVSGPDHFALLTARNAFFVDGWPARYTGFDYVAPEHRASVTELLGMVDLRTQPPFWLILAAALASAVLDTPEQHKQGQQLLRELLAQALSRGENWNTGLARQMLGRSLFPQRIAVRDPSQLEEAETLLREALDRFNELGDVREQALTYLLLGHYYLFVGEILAARNSFQKSQRILLDLGEPLIAATIESELGYLHFRLGETEAGWKFLQNSIKIYIDAGRLDLANGMLSIESYTALRYSTFEHALETRKRSLAISEQTGSLLNMSWDQWEMGEIQRVMGDFDAAIDWFEQARETFIRSGDDNGLTFYDRGLGDVLLAQGDYERAYQRYEASRKLAEHTGHVWSLTYAERGLGDAALGLGKLAAARQHLLAALSMVANQFSPGDPGGLGMMVFAAVARFLDAAGQREAAQRLAVYILSSSITWNETRRDLQALAGTDSVPLRPREDDDPVTVFATKSMELAGLLESMDIVS